MKRFAFAVLALSSSLVLSSCVADQPETLSEGGVYVLPAAPDPPQVAAPRLRSMTPELRQEIRAFCGDLGGATPLPDGPRDERADRKRDSAEAAEVPISEGRADVRELTPEDIRRLGQTIHETVAACWRVDPGRNDPAVTMTVELDPEGHLLGPPRVVEREELSDRWFRSAAYNACEAVVRCAPFSELPREHYGVWKSLRLRFDAAER